MKYYLAYGSNLNKAQMAIRCPDAKPVGAGFIPDHELVFRRGFLTIEPKEGVDVPVGIWKISDRDEMALDRYEGYPRFYFKREMTVSCNGKALDSMVYIMQDGHPIQRPSESYFVTVGLGYRDFEIHTTKPLVDAYLKAVMADYQTDYQG